MPLNDPMPNEPLRERLREANPNTPPPVEDRDADRAARLPDPLENPPGVGSNLGAASGEETMGTEGEPPPVPVGAEPDALRTADAHESGPRNHVPTVPRMGGPTHPATGFARDPRKFLAETDENEFGGYGVFGAGAGSGSSPMRGPGPKPGALNEWSDSDADINPETGLGPGEDAAI
ncbi:MAG: hypothetical protein IT337_07180 [Thermomicrobiales bacterium]|nr:hypothetical protein [Thermomicrobiales bacterium]